MRSTARGRSSHRWSGQERCPGRGSHRPFPRWCTATPRTVPTVSTVSSTGCGRPALTAPRADPNVAGDEAPGCHAGLHGEGRPGGLRGLVSPAAAGRPACGRRQRTPRCAGTLPTVTEIPHPLLPTATPVLQLDGDVLQVGGVDGRAGLRISPAAPELTALLHRLDGRRSQRAVRTDAVTAG